MASRWLDSPARYGLITRLLHWSIALMFVWQFTGMLIKITIGRHPVTSFMVAQHRPMGTLLMLLIAGRAIWAFSQWRRRPAHPPTFVGRAATAGHAALYALMIYVPAIALLREFGRTRAFAPWGIPLFSERAEEIVWMVATANASHGLIGWILLAVIAGHIAMVAVHHWWWRDDTLRKMTGPTAPQNPPQAVDENVRHAQA